MEKLFSITAVLIIMFSIIGVWFWFFTTSVALIGLGIFIVYGIFGSLYYNYQIQEMLGLTLLMAFVYLIIVAVIGATTASMGKHLKHKNLYPIDNVKFNDKERIIMFTRDGKGKVREYNKDKYFTIKYHHQNVNECSDIVIEEYSAHFDKYTSSKTYLNCEK